VERLAESAEAPAVADLLTASIETVTGDAPPDAAGRPSARQS
jgi:hypothetical protein